MRYLRYALGEILLVVIGILLALQINNWNEERIERRQIREYALNLSEAIERDMEMLLPVDMQIRASLRGAEELANYIRGRDIAQLNNADLFFLSRPIGYRSYAWNRAALEQLKASGGLRQMRNRRLAQLISEYDALTLHLDQDHSEDEESVRAIHDRISQLVDTNYQLDDLDRYLDQSWADGFTEEDMERYLMNYREVEAFRLLEQLALPLLSEDQVEYRRLANLSRMFGERVWPRTNLELPRLRDFAEEIQNLIAVEYE